MGVITGRDGSQLNTRGGTWSVTNPYSRPGVRRVWTNGRLSSGDQGVYSCTIPDDNEVLITINVGLYPNGYQGE